MLNLYAIKGPTGRLLKQLLRDKKLLGGPVQGAVNYGYGGDHGMPTLNANAGRLDKYRELVALDDAQVQTVPFSRSAADLDAPIFGRKFHHSKGADIFVYNIRPLLRGDHLSDFYTQLIPKVREYRVWVFRDKCLATYEKVLTYQHKLGKRGRSKAVWNWGNGYAFEFRQGENVPKRLKALGMSAVEALGLDFGAVDIIEDAHGWFYVLEVNTAPGTQGAARQGITSLVNCIERWAQGGFKER